MDLRGDMRTAMLAACKKEGQPPVIDKTITSIWDHFKKSQPLKLAEKGLADECKEKVSVWELLQRSLEKYGVHPKIVEITMKKLKAKHGENPTDTEARLMLG